MHTGWCVQMPRELLARNGKFVSVAPLRGGGGGGRPGFFGMRGGPRLLWGEGELPLELRVL